MPHAMELKHNRMKHPLTPPPLPSFFAQLRMVILPDMLKTAPMFKRFDPKTKNSGMFHGLLLHHAALDERL